MTIVYHVDFFFINLKNKSNQDFGIVRVEYCVFVNRKGYGQLKDVIYCETGILRKEIKPLSTTRFETDFHKEIIVRVIMVTAIHVGSILPMHPFPWQPGEMHLICS